MDGISEDSTWHRLVNAIRPFSPAVRVKWSGDNSPTPWEGWIRIASRSYLDTEAMGPVPFREVEWVEVDPSQRAMNGRLVESKDKEWRDSLLKALDDVGVSYSVVAGYLRVMEIPIQ